VKSHLESGHSRLNDVDEDGYTALHYAARYNRDAVMQVLVDAGAGSHFTILIHLVS